MENVKPLRPRGRGPQQAGGRRWRAWILLGGVPLLLVLASALRLWVDLLWYDELGHRDVLVTRLQWGGLVGLLAGIVAFLVVYVNLTITRRVARNDLYVPFLATGVNPDAPEQPTLPHFVLKPILLGASVLIGLFSGLAMSGKWETVLRWMGRSDFGMDDPLFGKDVSFYVFSMPLLELAVHAAQALLVVTALAAVASYVATGVIRYTPVPRIARPAIAHLSILAAVFFVIEAASYRLEVWNVVLSTRGAATGAGFTDQNARRPGFWIMVAVSLAVAVIIVYFAKRARWRVVGGAIGGWIALAAVFTGVVPSLVQSISVKPNELQREQHVLKGNIKMTRAAWGLGEVKKRDFIDEASLDDGDFEADKATLDNIRLWSPAVLQKTLAQMQLIRPYYEFYDVDVDRYTVNGRYRQVMITPRELNTQEIAGKTWTNQRLVFTHGYGVVAAWPNETVQGGRPSLLLRDFPPKPVGQDDLKLTEPAIYFGEEPDRHVLVNSKLKELDYPSKDGDEEVSYAGKGGIPVSSFARRVALAATFGDAQLLWSTQVTPKSRYMFRRNIAERVSELAPFLTLDRDPYPVITKGRVLWMMDAYTTSDRFPYSDYTELPVVGTRARAERINYMRNSVKVTIDAVDGDVKLYAVDEKDPILRAWRDIFPDLFTDGGKLPPELRAHLRYPEDLFNKQTDKWRAYHVDKPRTFYQKEDLWELPIVNGSPQDAFYLLARLPGEKDPEMLLVRPMTPAKRKNLIAYMAARMDGKHYGEVITFTLPKQSLTQGPQQVQALIKQDEEIREQLTLWQQGDTEPIPGDLLVLPIGKSLLYVQPYYLESAEGQLPEFERVVVALGDTIAWGSTFDEAVRELLAERAATVGDDRPADEGSGDVPSAPAADDAPDADAFAKLSSAELRDVLTEVSERYGRAAECQRKLDWACYGRETDAIDQLLKDAQAGRPRSR